MRWQKSSNVENQVLDYSRLWKSSPRGVFSRYQTEQFHSTKHCKERATSSQTRVGLFFLEVTEVQCKCRWGKDSVVGKAGGFLFGLCFYNLNKSIHPLCTGHSQVKMTYQAKEVLVSYNAPPSSPISDGLSGSILNIFPVKCILKEDRKSQSPFSTVVPSTNQG